VKEIIKPQFFKSLCLANLSLSGIHASSLKTSTNTADTTPPVVVPPPDAIVYTAQAGLATYQVPNVRSTFDIFPVTVTALFVCTAPTRHYWVSCSSRASISAAMYGGVRIVNRV
jgi:hypothetical protein